MKKLLATVLILVLCAVSLAEGGDMTSLVRAGGFEPVASENKSGILRCDYTLTGERTAAMVWTDAAQLYTVSGDSDALSKLYLDALDLGGWESCRYIVGEEARLSFGTVSAQRCESLGDYAALGFDLVLCGHAHGGQWRIPGLVNGVYAPNQGILPPYAGGRYDAGGTTMIVSRGLARETTAVPRIWNRPELVVAELHKEA